MAEIGGELGAMQGLASTFTAQQSAIESVISAINGQVNSSSGWWKGPRAERFRGTWPEYQTALRNLQTALGECNAEVANSIQGLQAVGG